jgi:adenylate kinase family enzyme
MKIHIIGDPGAGKTTLAHRLANHLGCAHVELDALYWGPNWSKAPEAVFRRQITHAVRTDAWVVDGDYDKVCDLVWAQADLVIWLDYSLGVILPRLTWRSARYALSREELWPSENQVTWRLLLGSQSILLRTLSTHYRRRRAYEALWKQSKFSAVQFVRLHSPYATQYWLHGFLCSPAGLYMQPLTA